MNEIKINILQKAKHLIECGMEEYICYAIDNVTIGQPKYYDIVIEMKTTITKGLYSEPADPALEGKTWKTLNTWMALDLERTDPDLKHRIQPYTNYNLMQLCRMAWIDKMIADLSHG